MSTRRGANEVQGRGQPPVLILIENASAEEVACTYIYIRVYAHEHRYRCNPRQLEAARERQRSGKCPRGAMVRGGNSIWHPHPRLNKAAPIRASSLSSRPPPPSFTVSHSSSLCVSLSLLCLSYSLILLLLLHLLLHRFLSSYRAN